MKQDPRNSDQPARSGMSIVRKLPEVTLLFWIIKLLTTGMGETTSDFLAHAMNPILAVALGGSGLIVSLLIQFSVRRYIPWVYWLAVTIVAIFGTMAADAIHVGLDVSYVESTIGFAVALAIIFAIWYVSEKTLSIRHIYTFRRELFYWAAVMATFALGTAAGDMTASTLGFWLLYVSFVVCYALCLTRDRILALRT